ncbi:MAG: ATP-binding cassette domain-containing protein [Candidatus Promineifilaceae bacterium]|nr:ATP-binding cassette domain-containing protein [Candidatus Promineifilaceae bacterium]
MIAVSALTFAYADQPPVFEALSWHVETGDAWAVLGPSGCGKTTLLYLLAGLLEPTEGSIRIGGQELDGPRPRTGLILQDYGLLPWATARRNVELGIEIRRFYGPDGKHAPVEETAVNGPARVSYWLERLTLQPHADKYPGQLSGGQRQRVAIARTLALEPDLLLMDEPFSSLDAPTRESLQTLTHKLRREARLTTIIVTHSIEEAAILGQKIVILGRPPNRKPTIVENPEAGRPDYRHQSTYFRMIKRLRRYLEPLQ